MTAAWPVAYRENGARRRDAIVEFVASYHRAHGYGPSLRDVAAAVGLATASAVSYPVQVLVIEGRLAMDPGVARSLRPVRLEMHSREPL